CLVSPPTPRLRSSLRYIHGGRESDGRVCYLHVKRGSFSACCQLWFEQSRESLWDHCHDLRIARMEALMACLLHKAAGCTYDDANLSGYCIKVWIKRHGHFLIHTACGREHIQTAIASPPLRKLSVCTFSSRLNSETPSESS